MFTKLQLDFIKASLCAQGAALPCHDNGKAARIFITVLDEIDAQLAVIESAPKPNESA